MFIEKHKPEGLEQLWIKLESLCFADKFCISWFAELHNKSKGAHKYCYGSVCFLVETDTGSGNVITKIASLKVFQDWLQFAFS